MSKIYNIIPGSLIDDNSIVNRIFTLIDSVEFDEWLEVNEEVYSLEFFQQNDEFYVMYLDPRGVIEKLYVTRCDDIISFMRERVDYEQGEGVDIAICTKEIANAVICNHDGQIFMLKAYF
ncbi:MAG: hypothetical protein IIW54_13080 [Lachnospiraceae bacterium]|nr:hypothetical protein [Lachnospiraceae bacterium]